MDNGIFSRKLAVVIITADTPLVDEGITVYPDSASGADSDIGHYIDLLSAWNIRWEILSPAGMRLDSFVSQGTSKYVAAIFAVPLASLSDGQLSIVREISFEHGVSIIAACNLPDQRSKSFFGVKMFRGRKCLWPLKVTIPAWPRDLHKGETVANFGLKSGLPGLRKGGFGKLSFRQTLSKANRLVKSLSIRYVAADLEPGVQVLSATLAGEPIAWSHRFGQAINYYFAMDHRDLLGKFNQMHRLVHAAIMANSGHGMAGVCLEKTMVVRLDDPGASKADYLESGKLMSEGDWLDFAAALEKQGIPLSVMYTPGWVDDGDLMGGTLFLNGEKITQRKTGEIHASPLVAYVPSDGRHEGYDHSSEYRGLKSLLRKNCVDIHSHGLTHLDPDHDNWSNASDKRTDSNWYHEFFHVKKNCPVEKEVQLKALVSSQKRIEDSFRVSPYAFTPSGHRHDRGCDILAHKAGYSLFSADYTGIAKDNLLIRNKRIVSIFLNFKEPTGFARDSGYPVIGVVHDYEIKDSIASFVNMMHKWKQGGIQRFVSLKDLIASLCSTIDASYCPSESRISIDVTYSDRLINKRRYFTLAGALVTLQICIPANAQASVGNITASNGTILSIERTADDIQVVLELKEALSCRIEVPLTARALQ